MAELTPQAVAAAGGLGQAESDSTSALAQYMSYYYVYDSDYRVTRVSVNGSSGAGLGGSDYAGWSQTETFQYTEGTDSQSDINAWTRKTIEWTYGSDGNLQNTYTVYTNYLGQTLLSDLLDTSGDHTFACYQYNNADSDLMLQAPSSAIAGYWDGRAPRRPAIQSPTIPRASGLPTQRPAPTISA